MAYVVLARKYRPATLTELVGQEHIARALCNAIEMNRVPHALLFCGARGTGKTSTARIVAKMLNCVNGPTPHPCGVCSACKEITASNCIDVHELDAASNRGIDEIRELRSGVGYAPVRDRRKIYIIDEAHMLTNEAANAFLKTLEEPPAHVSFILATTDPQRLPITIRSRCQRYDFRRVKAGDVVQRLAEICTSEGVKAELESLYLVAREGDGSMRDSLSVLDQVIAFGGAELKAEEVAGLLGVADRNRTHALLLSLLTRNSQLAIESVAAAHDHGMDLKTFARTIAMEARDVLVTRLTGTNAKDLVDRAQSEIEQLAAMSAGVETPELERLAHVLLELAEQVARASHPRLTLELGVVRLCRAPALVDVASLATRVESMLAGGRGSLPNRGSGSFGASGGSGPTRPPVASAGPAEGAPPARNTAPSSLSPASSPSSSGLAVQAVPMMTSSPGLMAPRQDTSKPVAPKPLAPTAGALTDGQLLAWLGALRDAGKPTVASLLERALGTHADNVVTLHFGTDFLTASAKEADAVIALQAAATGVLGPVRVEIGLVDARATHDSLAGRRQRERVLSRQERETQLRDLPAVHQVIDAFQGEVTVIHVEETVH